MRLQTSALLLFGYLIAGGQTVLANMFASEQGLIVQGRQAGPNNVRFVATNTTNETLRFSFKVLYSYQTVIGDKHTASRTIDASLIAHQSSNYVGKIVGKNILVRTIRILYIY